MKYMHLIFALLLIGLVSCKTEEKAPDPQSLVDQAIAASGGERYARSDFQFEFRDKTYTLERSRKGRILKRLTSTDSSSVLDVLQNNRFSRYINDSLVYLPDSLVAAYSSSVNSVHYFAYLPYGLNDAAVQKSYLGNIKIGDKRYHKVRITFDQQGGGEDFEDVFIYWFNTETKLPDYLAYEYHTNGGGKRFREAFNARYVDSIRFVDYLNYEYEGDTALEKMDSLFLADQLDLLSKIELDNIQVIPGNYN